MVFVPSIGPVTPDLCDHDRLTCSECIDTCRVCEMTLPGDGALAEHVASEHEVTEYDCRHCGRPGGH